jgi:uncharacterized protein YndB with AHSA1/START domain
MTLKDSSPTAEATETTQREVVITRIFDAPRSLVFQAWTDPKHMANWWGPNGFTNPVCEMDVRVGGAYHIVMRGPDGADYPCRGVYREIVEPERLLFTNLAVDKEGNVLLDGFTTVTFEEHGGKTKLTLQTRATGLVAGAERMLAGMEAGWTQSLDKLSEHLRQEPSDRELVFTRVFNAPRDLVFKVWTDPKHIVEWWGPRGFTTESLDMDVRPGGHWRLIMHGPDGVDYRNRIVYLEVVKPERLVYKHTGNAEEDEDEEEGKEGKEAKDRMKPVGFHVTVTFEEAGGSTKLTMRMLFESAGERDDVVTKYGADKGAVQTLDRLAEHLATLI